ncbi:MAG: hypothetical protein ACOYW4_07620 [Bacillota bacterium]
MEQGEIGEVEQGLFQVRKGRTKHAPGPGAGAVEADSMLDPLNRLKERQQILAQGNVSEAEMEAWRQTAREWLESSLSDVSL